MLSDNTFGLVFAVLVLVTTAVVIAAALYRHYSNEESARWSRDMGSRRRKSSYLAGGPRISGVRAASTLRISSLRRVSSFQQRLSSIRVVDLAARASHLRSLRPDDDDDAPTAYGERKYSVRISPIVYEEEPDKPRQDEISEPYPHVTTDREREAEATAAENAAMVRAAGTTGTAGNASAAVTSETPGTSSPPPPPREDAEPKKK